MTANADAAAYGHLLTLITALASSDNALRTNAERELQEDLIKNAPQLVLPAMAQIARDHADPTVPFFWLSL